MEQRYKSLHVKPQTYDAMLDFVSLMLKDSKDSKAAKMPTVDDALSYAIDVAATALKVRGNA